MLKKKNRKGEEIILRLSSLLQNQKKTPCKAIFFFRFRFYFFSIWIFFFPRFSSNIDKSHKTNQISLFKIASINTNE